MAPSATVSKRGECSAKYFFQFNRFHNSKWSLTPKGPHLGQDEQTALVGREPKFARFGQHPPVPFVQNRGGEKREPRHPRLVLHPPVPQGIPNPLGCKSKGTRRGRVKQRNSGSPNWSRMRLGSVSRFLSSKTRSCVPVRSIVTRLCRLRKGPPCEEIKIQPFGPIGSHRIPLLPKLTIQSLHGNLSFPIWAKNSHPFSSHEKVGSSVERIIRLFFRSTQDRRPEKGHLSALANLNRLC